MESMVIKNTALGVDLTKGKDSQIIRLHWLHL